MVRDAVTKTASVQYKTYTEWDDGYRQNESTFNVTRTTDKHYRGDLIKSDGHAPTPYEGMRYSIMGEPFKRFNSWKYGGASRNGVLVYGYYRSVEEGVRFPEMYGSADTSFPSSLEHLARQARANVLTSLVSSDVNVGQFLGELPESTKMIATQSIKVLQAYRAVRSGNFSRIPKILGVKRRRNLPGNAAGVWFAYKFGWEPLVKDVYNMQSAVLKQLNRPRFEKRTRVMEQDFLNTLQSSAATVVEKGDCMKGVVLSVSYSIENQTLAGLNSLGLINPAAIAWELLPLSFVVDWFVPIGGFITQLTAPLGLKFAHGYETRFARCDIKATDEPSARTARPLGTHARWYVTGSGFKRTRLDTWPIPSLVVDFGINRGQALTLSGLLAQRVR